jgi:uncharacterized protein (DUF2062 family)
VVFRRREPLTYAEWLREGVWPRAGWRRALSYIGLRLRRLPDTPEKIGRGVWAGVFVSFTPFFGLHFLLAFLVARVLRGNVFAAIIGTFVLNPLTVVPMSLAAMETGRFLLIRGPAAPGDVPLSEAFGAATRDLWQNLLALFGQGTPDWTGLALFWDAIFLPYLIGGLIPGAIVASALYVVTVQLARAQQAHSRRSLRRRMAALHHPPELPPQD